MKNENETAIQKQDASEITLISYIVLFIVVIMFSGVFANATGAFSILKSIDYSTLIGSFGKIYEKNIFRGAGGSGARDGFLMALSLVPSVMLALGIVNICDGFGGLRAADKLFSPFLSPCVGIPGVCGLSFIGSLQSVDSGAGMTKELFDMGLIDEKERTIFCQLQITGDAPIGNYFASAPMVFPFMSTMPIGIPFLVILIMKFVAANMMRAMLRFTEKTA